MTLPPDSVSDMRRNQDEPTITMPVSEYKLLLEHIEDDMIVTCEHCGAWLHRDDPACATTEDWNGCWYMATDRDRDRHLCRAYRSPEQYHRDNYEARKALRAPFEERG